MSDSNPPTVASAANTHLIHGPSRIAKRRPTFKTDSLVHWVVSLAAAALVLVPLVPIIYQSFLDKPLYEKTRSLTLHNYTKVLGSGTFWKVVGTTTVFALATTFLAVTIGSALAVILSRTDVPGRQALRGAILLPFYMSPLVLAFSWVIVYGPAGFVTMWVQTHLNVTLWHLYSVPGIALASAVYFLPFTFLYTIGSLSLTDPTLEDAGRVAGAKPLRTLWSVTVPLLRPAFTYSLLLTFVSAVEMLSIPLVLGSPVNIEVLPSYLYEIGLVGGGTDYGAIAAIAILMLLVITGMVWLQVKATGAERRFVTVGGKATRPRVLKLGRLRWPIFGAVMTYVVLFIVIPVVGLFAQSFTSFLSPLISPWSVKTLSNFRAIFDEPAFVKAIVNSLKVATIGAAGAIFFITFVALVATRSDFRYRKALTYLALYPRAVPGLIVGIGFLWVFLLVPGLGGMRNGMWALGIAFVMRFIPLGYGTVAPAILRISPELDRAGRVAGANWTKTQLRIILPLLRPALVSGFILLFISFIKEYSSALFLVTPNSEVIGTTMISLWRQGNSGPVAALSVLQLVITAAVFSLSRLVPGVRTNKTGE